MRAAAVTCRFAGELLVVPANAGTHNHECVLLDPLVASASYTQTLVVMGPGSRSAWPGRRDQIALAAILTINASSAVLKKNEMMPCAVTVRRMVLSVMPTSETCAVMPITNEKYTKSQ